MPALVAECKQLFGDGNLYTILGVPNNATDSAVKRGYHRLSLKVHPDRVSDHEKEEATKKFQVLGKIYSILCDKEKRTLYDSTGEIDDDDDSGLSENKDWEEYWRILFKKISVEDIKQYEKKYKESEEELDDLKAAYLDGEGDLNYIMDNVLCATIDDEERFKEILNNLIKRKELPKYKKFSAESKTKRKNRRAKAESEALEAEEALKELGVDEDSSLTALIKARNAQRAEQADGFFAHLEQKYAPKPKKAKSKKSAK